MRATCPDCGTQGHIAAFLVEDEGKRLAAVLAGMAPDLGRSSIAYLGLFKPAKTALRLARAVKLLQDLDAMVATGSVCRDERGLRRPATAATWAAGIEQMLAQRATLTLPLENHNYLRTVVFALADKADAAQERQRDEALRTTRTSRVVVDGGASESKLANTLAWVAQQLSVGLIDEAKAAELRQAANEKHGEA